MARAIERILELFIPEWRGYDGARPTKPKMKFMANGKPLPPDGTLIINDVIPEFRVKLSEDVSGFDGTNAVRLEFEETIREVIVPTWTGFDDDAKVTIRVADGGAFFIASELFEVPLEFE